MFCWEGTQPTGTPSGLTTTGPIITSTEESMTSTEEFMTSTEEFTTSTEEIVTSPGITPGTATDTTVLTIKVKKHHLRLQNKKMQLYVQM